MGSGPFKFVEFVRDDRVVLERNDDYWGGPAKFKTLVYRRSPKPPPALPSWRQAAWM